MIMDRITDLFVTAWELIGLVFLAMSADLLMPRRPERGEADREDAEDIIPPRRLSSRNALRQPQFI